MPAKSSGQYLRAARTDNRKEVPGKPADYIRVLPVNIGYGIDEDLTGVQQPGPSSGQKCKQPTGTSAGCSQLRIARIEAVRTLRCSRGASSHAAEGSTRSCSPGGEPAHSEMYANHCARACCWLPRRARSFCCPVGMFVAALQLGEQLRTRSQKQASESLHHRRRATRCYVR